MEVENEAGKTPWCSSKESGFFFVVVVCLFCFLKLFLFLAVLHVL